MTGAASGQGNPHRAPRQRGGRAPHHAPAPHPNRRALLTPRLSPSISSPFHLTQEMGFFSKKWYFHP